MALLEYNPHAVFSRLGDVSKKKESTMKRHSPSVLRVCMAIFAATVFSALAPAQTYPDLFDFAGGCSGGFPLDPPIGGSDGKLYMTTPIGAFLVYKITTAGVATSIASLDAPANGPLTLGTDGKLYGITQVGGTNKRGSVFSVTTTGVLKTMFSFADATGSLPFGPILQGADGNFYGT